MTTRPLVAVLAAAVFGAATPPLHAQTSADPGMGARLALDNTVSPPTLRFSWWGRSGRHYFVLRTEDLAGQWTPMPGLNPRGADAVLTYVEPQAAIDPASLGITPAQVFFRVAEFDPSSPPLIGNALSDPWELFYFGATEVPPSADPDSDGLSNLTEYQLALNPISADTDGDMMRDGWEITHQFDPTANDGSGDADGDGLTNARESALGTNPRSSDSDGDELPDGWEASHGLEVTGGSASADLDGDGISNLDEYRHQTDPQRPHPGWVYFALPSSLIPVAASPDGAALLRDDTHYWRWGAGNLTQLEEYSDQVRIAPRTYRSTSAVLNRRGDVAIQTTENRLSRNEDGSVGGSAVQTRVYPASGAPTWSHTAPTYTAVSDFTDGMVSDENGNFVRWERHTEYSNHFGSVTLGEDGALWGVAPVGVDSTHDENLNAIYQSFRSDLLRVPPGGGAGVGQRARVTAFRGVDAQGRAIGQAGPNGSEAFVGTTTVAYTPSTISHGGQVVGDLAGQQRLYALGDSAGRALPAAGYPYYFDAQERLNERAWNGAGFDYFLLTPTLHDGGWRRMPHVALPLPAGWTSAHRIAPGSESAQLGYASIAGALAQPFLALPNPARLLVDNDRDGTPTNEFPDLMTPEKPFRFWVNDDDDVDTNDPDDSEKAPIEAADWTDNKIDGIRDLEDFARLTIHFGGLHEAILNGTMKIGLKWKNVTSGAPSVKIWRNLSPNGGTE